MISRDVARFASRSATSGPAWPRWAGALLACTLSLLLYVHTAAPGLTWAHDGADGGDLIVAAMTWGVPHPSGYPTYCLLARLFAQLPLGPIARRFNLFSGICAALAVALVYLGAQRMLQLRWTGVRWRPVLFALMVSLLFATGATWWSQAIITEVYALQGLFSALCIWLTLRLCYPLDKTPGIGSWLGLGAAFGLGLGAHLTLALLGPGLLILLVPRLTLKRAFAGGCGLGLGLLVFLYLPLAASAMPLVNWGGADTWAGFWWLISGKPYQNYALALPLSHFPARLGAWAARWRQELTFPGLLIALLGLAGWFERDFKPLARGTLTVALSFSLYAITYNTTDSYVYLLAFYLITPLWVAEGLARLWDWAAEYSGRRPILGTLAIVLLSVALSAWSVASNTPVLDLSSDREATTWLQDALAALPPNALLITGQDRHTFALDYAQWVEGQRQDVITIDGELLPSTWYQKQLAVRHPYLANRTLPSSLPGLISAFQGERPIYLSSARPEIAAYYAVQADGPIWRISALSERDGAAK